MLTKHGYVHNWLCTLIDDVIPISQTGVALLAAASMDLQEGWASKSDNTEMSPHKVAFNTAGSTENKRRRRKCK